MKRFQILSSVLLFLIARFTAPCASILPLSADDQVRAADAVFRGTVLKCSGFRSSEDGMIYTRTLLRVDETFKGRLPGVIQVVHHGGAVEGIGQSDSSSPQFKVGEEYLLFVSRRSDRTLGALQGIAGTIALQRDQTIGLVATHRRLLDDVRARTDFGNLPGADLTDQAADADSAGSVGEPSGDTGGPSVNGLLVDQSFSHPMRFPAPDRGDSIPYLVDTNHLPTGITPAQGLAAVSNAFAAWTAVSSCRAVFIGTQTLSTNAAAINTNDGIIRVQLHDQFNYITETNVLGKGGSYFTVGLLPSANWGPGGSVGTNEFNKSVCGFVVLKHTNNLMTNLTTFTEVLTHEVGHVLGLAHSSENSGETNNVLKQAVMYFTVHADGRGATLGAYDPPVVRLVHPSNTPPYTISRVMDITSAPVTPNVAGINEIEMRGYDLQSTNVTLAVTNASSGNGTFSVTNGNKIKFTPAGNFGDSPRFDPASQSNYGSIYTRHSDGTNASAYATANVVSFNHDNFPIGAVDGIPDNWMVAWFGNANPATGSNHQATNDFDGDGLNNFQEYRSGMVPTNSASVQRITFFNGSALLFQAKAYELYEIQGSSNFVDWTVVRAVLPTNAPIEVRTSVIATNIVTTVSNLPAGNPKMFFRVLKVP